MTGALAAAAAVAAAIPRTALVHHAAHHTLISLSAKRSASSLLLLESTTPCDAFDTGRLGQSRPSCRAPIQSIFSRRLWSWAPSSQLLLQISFLKLQGTNRKRDTSLALAKDMDVGFAAEAVSAVVDAAFPRMYFWGKSIQTICCR